MSSPTRQIIACLSSRVTSAISSSSAISDLGRRLVSMVKDMLTSEIATMSTEVECRSSASKTERKKPCTMIDRKSTRLNSSHSQISYAVFCLKKKKKRHTRNHT